jgi:hypothetical protein
MTQAETTRFTHQNLKLNLYKVNAMKTLMTIAAMTALLTASTAFADDQTTPVEKAPASTTEIVAFQDIESSPVSASEMETAGAWMIRWGSFCVSSNDACK